MDHAQADAAAAAASAVSAYAVKGAAARGKGAVAARAAVAVGVHGAGGQGGAEAEAEAQEGDAEEGEEGEAEEEEESLPPPLCAALAELQRVGGPPRVLRLSNLGLRDVHLLPLIDALQGMLGLETLDLSFNRQRPSYIRLHSPLHAVAAPITYDCSPHYIRLQPPLHGVRVHVTCMPHARSTCA